MWFSNVFGINMMMNVLMNVAFLMLSPKRKIIFINIITSDYAQKISLTLSPSLFDCVSVVLLLMYMYF